MPPEDNPMDDVGITKEWQTLEDAIVPMALEYFKLRPPTKEQWQAGEIERLEHRLERELADWKQDSLSPLLHEWAGECTPMQKHVAPHPDTCRRIVAQLEGAGLKEEASWAKWILWWLTLSRSRENRFVGEVLEVEAIRLGLENNLDAAESSLSELREKLTESQKQVSDLLRSKAAAEREMYVARHDLNGMIGCVSGNRGLVERAGIPVAPATGRLKDDAVILLNTACAAATGKSYLPYAQEQELRERLKAAEGLAEAGRQTVAMIEFRYQETASAREMRILPADAIAPLKAALAAYDAKPTS